MYSLHIPQLHPQSLQLFELMCWCWSDKPQHRPTFRQILKIIKADSFTHLLEATPMTAGSRKNQVTAACLKSVISSTPQSSIVRTLPSISDDGFTMTYCTASKVLSPVEIWYGTRCGSCGVVCFHQSLTVKVHKLTYTCICSVMPTKSTLALYSYMYTCSHTCYNNSLSLSLSLSFSHAHMHNRISSCQLKGNSTFHPS